VDIEVDSIGSIVVVKPSGRVDGKAAQELQQQLSTTLPEDVRSVVLDLVDIEHLGGAGIRLLINLSKTLGRRGGGLVLCGLADRLKKAFNLAGVTQRFVIAKTRDEAVQMLLAKEKVAQLSDEAARLLATPGKRDGSADGGG